MKKIFTLSFLALFISLIFSGCMKERVYQADDNYWFSKERGQVVFSSGSCGYYIVETDNGYSVLRSVDYLPYEGDVLYGDFSYDGQQDIYNRSDGSIIAAIVKDYWLSYAQAQDEINYYCY